MNCSQRGVQMRLDLENQIRLELAGRRTNQPVSVAPDADLRDLVREKRMAFGLTPTQQPVKPAAHRQAAARRSRGNDSAARRRRALHAMQGLPNRLRTDPRFTDAFFLVLEMHYRMADDTGQWQPSLPEITNRLKLSRSTVLRAHELLQAEGLLLIERRRIATDRNETNIYALGDELMKGRQSPHKGHDKSYSKLHRGVGVSNDTAKGESISSLSTTHQKPVSEAMASEEIADRQEPDLYVDTSGISQSTPSSKKADEKPLSPSPPPTEAQIAVLREVNAVLDADQPENLSVQGLIKRAETLRTEEIPTLFAPLWRIGLRRHGFAAIMAVFETVLLTRTDYVHTPHGYLYGILRKPRGAIAPDISMSLFLMQRRLPKGLRKSAKIPPSLSEIRKKNC